MSDNHPTLTIEQLTAWSEGLAHVLTSVDEESTPNRLCAAISALVPFDFSAMFVLSRNSAPVEILDDIPQGTEPISYLESPYLLDPVYNEFLRGKLAACNLLDDIAPDNFFQSDYFLNYWSVINVVSEFSFNAWVDEDTAIHVPLSRIKGSKPFSNDDQEVLRAIGPIVNRIMMRFWDAEKSRYSNSDPDAESFHQRLSFVLENFGSSMLTPREMQIARLTMRGFSDKLCARELDITPGTIRNHKKSIFSKLQVSSQGQVFALLLDVLQLPPGREYGPDPLVSLREFQSNDAG